MKDINETLLISIIVPIYSVEKYICSCIESLIDQTYTNIEIILVDDGSPDMCGKICDEYAQRDNRIQVIHKENGGLISARKAGLAKAAGEYITFVDGDDYVRADMCQKMYEAAYQYSPDIIAAGFTFVYPDEKAVYSDNLPGGYYDKKGLIKNVYRRMMCHDDRFNRGISPAVWCKWFRKTVISQVLPFIDERITDGEDVACTYPCILKAQSLYIYKDMFQYQYRVNPASMSRKYNKNWYKNLLYLFHWLDEICSEDERALLGDSYEMEKFYALYRYINKELRQKEKKFPDRVRTLKMVADFPEVRQVMSKVSLKHLKIAMSDKLKIYLLMKCR